MTGYSFKNKKTVSTYIVYDVSVVCIQYLYQRRTVGTWYVYILYIY